MIAHTTTPVGEEEKGVPTMIGNPDLGQEMLYAKKPPWPYGQRQAAAMALRAACSGKQITDYTHTMASVAVGSESECRTRSNEEEDDMITKGAPTRGT